MIWIAYAEYRGIRRIKPFLRYVSAKLNLKTEEDTYRNFVTRSLQLIPEGKALKTNLYDLLHPQIEVEEKDAETIIDEVVGKSGGILRIDNECS